jgi:hypothetical protein
MTYSDIVSTLPCYCVLGIELNLSRVIGKLQACAYLCKGAADQY